MRKLTYQERRWAESLSSLSTQSTSKWLEDNFFREVEGRALIIQAQENYAVLFLTNELFNDEEKKNEQIGNFFSLISFFRFLHHEGYITITRGKDTRESPMFFLQDAFTNPKPTKGKIILNAKGEYTEKPDKIHDTDQKTVYQGIMYDQDHYDMIISVCTGSMTVSNSIKELYESQQPEKKEEQEDKPVKRKSSSKTSLIIVSFCILTISVLCLFIYLEFSHHKKLLNKRQVHQYETGKKLDSLMHFVRSYVPSSTAQSSNQKHYGIDVSKWNGDIVAEIDQLDNLTFVICKATQGIEYVDPRFKDNWKMIASKHLIRGAYHFYDANEDAIDQAQHFAETIGNPGKKTIAPILDIEPASFPNGITVDAMDLQVDLLLFLKHVERLTKRKPIVYTDPSFANEYLRNKKFASYPLWIADYTRSDNPTIPETWKKHGFKFWQKSDSHKLGSKQVDFDVFNGHLEDIWK